MRDKSEKDYHSVMDSGNFGLASKTRKINQME